MLRALSLPCPRFFFLAKSSFAGQPLIFSHSNTALLSPPPAVTKTGQFGLGFNSVYHITDLPCFCTGSLFVCFDPHNTYLPPQAGGGGGGGGIQIRLTAEGNAAGGKSGPFHEQYPDQFAPFKDVFGCDGKGENSF